MDSTDENTTQNENDIFSKEMDDIADDEDTSADKATEYRIEDDDEDDDIDSDEEVDGDEDKSKEIKDMNGVGGNNGVKVKDEEIPYERAIAAVAAAAAAHSAQQGKSPSEEAALAKQTM